MESFATRILGFYRELNHIPEVPDTVEVLYPHRQPQTWEVMTRFYHKFYNDNNQRVFLIGINPGRFGGGTTGIPFTDPIRLQDVCGIDHEFQLKPELSSRFIYHMIEAFGGVASFYRKCFFTSVSPLGFTRSGKNLNYYDLRELQDHWELFMVDCLKAQINMGACAQAFSLGQGQNHKYLTYINRKYHLFKKIHPLPHPRWIMQYRLKKLDEFVQVYCKNLRQINC